MKQKQKKYIINQYLEIGGRLQLIFSNLRLDFRLKYWFVGEAISNNRLVFFLRFLDTPKRHPLQVKVVFCPVILAA